MEQAGALHHALHALQLWREARGKTHGAPLLMTEKLYANFAEVKYQPDPELLSSLDSEPARV